MTRPSYRTVAASVAANKAAHPTKYCQTPGCLWRIETTRGPVPCPKHPVPAVPERTEAST